MFSLQEYKVKKTLADLMPWALIVEKGIILNKDGSLQSTVKFRGPDLISATDTERNSLTAQINEALKRLGSGWVIYSETARTPSKPYQTSQFNNELSTIIDWERAEQFKDSIFFESNFYLTFQYLPPTDKEKKMEDFIIESEKKGKKKINRLEDVVYFKELLFQVLSIFDSHLREITILNDDETLTYLHQTISNNHHSIKSPDIPIYLDSYLTDTPFLGGVHPKLGDKHLKIITINSFPARVFSQILDKLNDLPFPYR